MTRSTRTSDEADAVDGLRTPDAVHPGTAQRRVWKTAEVVAFAMVRYIVDHGMRFGDRLPSESEMLAHYQVSRESLREALRLLEAQGIVSIRRGPSGGPVVGRAETANLARTLTLYFQLAGATYEELLQAWRMLEPLAAELAAGNVARDRRASRDAASTSSATTTTARSRPTWPTPTGCTSPWRISPTTAS